MSMNRLKLIALAILIVVMVGLMLWFPSHVRRAETQRMIDQADQDVAAAKAAADSAAGSAAKAKGAAQDLQNRLPGSS
jgi:type II secretory pathway pseudopilin PulG